jgi:ADP-heptose:LPS heptosyltransferase
LNFKKLKNEYGDDIIYIGYDYNDYTFFKSTFDIDVEYYEPTSFEDMCIVINSCKLFISGISCPLCISMALHKKMIISLSHNLLQGDNVLFDKFNEMFDFILYSYNY